MIVPIPLMSMLVLSLMRLKPEFPSKRKLARFAISAVLVTVKFEV